MPDLLLRPDQPSDRKPSLHKLPPAAKANFALELVVNRLFFTNIMLGHDHLRTPRSIPGVDGEWFKLLVVHTNPNKGSDAAAPDVSSAEWH